MIIKFHKIHENANTPYRANPSDAGMDLFYASENSAVSYAVKPGENVVLSTGLSVEIPHGYAMEIKNRSSVASKRNLIVGAHLIDSGYSGEIKIDIHNIGNTEQVISPGDKIAQFVIYPIVQVRMMEVAAKELYNDEVTISQRKKGGFGSTN